MATLMFNTQEVAVKQLFHQNGTNSVAQLSLSNYFSGLHSHVWFIFLHVYQAYLLSTYPACDVLVLDVGKNHSMR